MTYDEGAMKKNLRAFLVATSVIAAAAIAATTVRLPSPSTPKATDGAATDPRNAAYGMDGKTVAFRNGNADGASMFGIPTEGDLDDDGDRDAVVIFTTDGGGSGTFFYVAAALRGDGGYFGTDAVLVGDRIAPDTTSVQDGTVAFNYATRHPWEPFTAQTSVGKTKRLRVMDGALVEERGERLAAEVAERLATKAWGDCMDADCAKFTVETLDGVDGVWYVQATYDGFMDDSIKAERKIAAMHHTGTDWVLGATLIEHKQCREGRGHQDFSAEPCK